MLRLFFGIFPLRFRYLINIRFIRLEYSLCLWLVAWRFVFSAIAHPAIRRVRRAFLRFTIVHIPKTCVCDDDDDDAGIMRDRERATQGARASLISVLLLLSRSANSPFYLN